MRLLLDPHALVWWLYKPSLLSVPVREAIVSKDNEVFSSAASAYEIANKRRLGKWPEVAQLASGFDGILVYQSISILPITSYQARSAASFPAEHRDPFDRLLAAQALSEECILVTRDEAFRQFNVQTLW